MADSRRIVVVEDVFVRTFLRTALQRHGHQVTCASPTQAVELLKAGSVDLLVTNTPQLFAEFGSRVPLLYLAAFPDPLASMDFKRCLALRKPFQTADMVAMVERLLGTV
jgi:DNA-binding response OmpR family regulator